MRTMARALSIALPIDFANQVSVNGACIVAAWTDDSVFSRSRLI